jgi:undecaprenyl diphosphate synthase
VPNHVAVIMDGNGRWAAARGMPRVFGHRKGVDAVRRAVRAAAELGVRYLTIYSFSSENWSRPADEVAELISLLKRFIRKDLAELHASNVRVRVIGERGRLDSELRGLMAEAEDLTAANDGLTLVVAFNYGARQEILRAAAHLARDVAAGRIDASKLELDDLAIHLDTADMPDPDLIVRTSGEQRLSNFLLWQAAYAEFVFLPVLWPDFDRRWFEVAIAEYAKRDRRFGGLAPSATA